MEMMLKGVVPGAGAAAVEAACNPALDRQTRLLCAFVKAARNEII